MAATISTDLKLGFGVGFGLLLAFLVWGLFQSALSKTRNHNG